LEYTEYEKITKHLDKNMGYCAGSVFAFLPKRWSSSANKMLETGRGEQNQLCFTERKQWKTLRENHALDTLAKCAQYIQKS
jgi:hypothetical protein